MNLFLKILAIPRVKAALIHLGISAIVACAVVYLVFGVWYAAPWADALGVSKIFLIILGVDLCLGPLLTLVVFKVGKPSLKFDLTVIACLQIAALGYGLYTVGLARPAYTVFSKDRFDAVLANEVYKAVGEGKTLEFIEQSPWVQPLFGAKIVGANIPTDNAMLAKLGVSALGGGVDVQNLQNLHLPYAAVLADIQNTAKPIATLSSTKPAVVANIKLLQAKYPANAVVSPLKIKFDILTVVMQKSDGKILGIEEMDVFE